MGAGLGTEDHPISTELILRMKEYRGFFPEGVFALEQGFVFTSIILSALTVSIIDRKFYRAAFWSLLGAALSLLGVLHSYRIIYSDIVSDFTPAWKWFWGYLALALTLILTPHLIQEPKTDATDSTDFTT